MILFKDHSGHYKWGVEESTCGHRHQLGLQGGDYSRFGKLIGVGDGEIGVNLRSRTEATLTCSDRFDMWGPVEGGKQGWVYTDSGKRD